MIIAFRRNDPRISLYTCKNESTKDPIYKREVKDQNKKKTKKKKNKEKNKRNRGTLTCETAGLFLARSHIGRNRKADQKDLASIQQ